jgi:hypothetical protein
MRGNIMRMRTIVAAMTTILAVAVIMGHEVYALLMYGHISPKLGWAVVLAPSALLLMTLSAVWTVRDRRQQQRSTVR